MGRGADVIRYTSLASSSTYGNSYLIEGPGPTRVLVDCGPRLRRLEAHLWALGVPPSSIDAVFITHEHIDHTYCLNLRRPFAARNAIPVYAHESIWADCPGARDTLCGSAWGRCLEDGGPVRPIEAGREIIIGSLAIQPFSTPHDARAPLGFVISCDHTALGIATDLGHVSTETATRLQGCNHLILESNHDRHMEISSGRPWSLIWRVLGDWGHLSNDQAAAALRQLADGATRTVLLAHLSLDCNLPELALETVAAGLEAAGWKGSVVVAPASSPSGWLGR
jgi:phosphoribosyl 1,2-cyclic phosphodiesterase